MTHKRREPLKQCRLPTECKVAGVCESLRDRGDPCWLTGRSLMESTRAAVAYINTASNSCGQAHEDLKFEAFMSLFHPHIAQDRGTMLKLRRRETTRWPYYPQPERKESAS